MMNKKLLGLAVVSLFVASQSLALLVINNSSYDIVLGRSKEAKIGEQMPGTSETEIGKLMPKTSGKKMETAHGFLFKAGQKKFVIPRLGPIVLYKLKEGATDWAAFSSYKAEWIKRSPGATVIEIENYGGLGIRIKVRGLLSKKSDEWHNMNKFVKTLTP